MGRPVAATDDASWSLMARCWAKAARDRPDFAASTKMFGYGSGSRGCCINCDVADICQTDPQPQRLGSSDAKRTQPQPFNAKDAPDVLQSLSVPSVFAVTSPSPPYDVGSPRSVPLYM